MSTKFTRSYFFRKNIHPVLAKLPIYDYWLLRKKSYLAQVGWFKSFRSGKSIDSKSHSIPWITYPAIEILNDRLPGDAVVFEYGSGLGTGWWAARVKHITAVEHDAVWVEKVKDDMPGNVEILFRKLGERYINAVSEKDEKYDLIIIDGRKRVACCRQAVRFLSGRGVVLYDDSGREKYREGVQFLLDEGFRQLPLRGFSPIEFMPCETSIFYRNGNLLGL